MLVAEKKHRMIQKKVKDKKILVFTDKQNNSVIQITGTFSDTIEKVLKEALRRTQYVIEEDDESYGDPNDYEWFRESTKRLRNGKIIAVLRDDFSLSQGDLGKKIGVGRKYISDMENGRRRVSIKMAEKLGGVFDRDPKDFIHFGEE